ncbi:unnamed protein product, partial [marine sediment metagenome]
MAVEHVVVFAIPGYKREKQPSRLFADGDVVFATLAIDLD